MIDRGVISAQIRIWVEEMDGLGFHRPDGSFLEDARDGKDRSKKRPLTARGTQTRSRREPPVKVTELTEPSRQCDRIMRTVVRIDRRYYQALLLYSCVPGVSQAARAMRRNVYDFTRLAEGGFGAFAALATGRPAS